MHTNRTLLVIEGVDMAPPSGGISASTNEVTMTVSDVARVFDVPRVLLGETNSIELYWCGPALPGA